jgi:hypothetical protein
MLTVSFRSASKYSCPITRIRAEPDFEVILAAQLEEAFPQTRHCVSAFANRGKFELDVPFSTMSQPFRGTGENITLALFSQIPFHGFGDAKFLDGRSVSNCMR